MNAVRLVKKCIETPEYMEGVAGALAFLDVDGQGKGELRKIVEELNDPDLFTEGEDE